MPVPLAPVLAAVRSWWLDPIIFGPICCVTLVVGCLIYLFIRKQVRRRRILGRGGVRVEGVVVGHVRRPLIASKPEDNLRFHPEIEFQTANGQMVRHVSEDGSMTPEPALGAKVPIVYNPANPGEALLWT